MLENTLWMLFLMALTAVMSIQIIKDKPGRLWLVVFIELALLLRFIFIYIAYANGTEYSGTDGLIYHQVAKDIAAQLKGGTPLWNIRYEYTWYTVLMGLQYAVLGINRYAASFVNAFIAVLSGLLLIAIGYNLNFSRKKSRFIGLAYLFMPSMIVWTTDTRKESMIFFILTLIWYLTLRVIKERNMSPRKQALYIASVCVLLYLSTLLRIYMLYTIGGGLFICLLFHYLKTRRNWAIAFCGAVIFTCVLVTFTTVLVNMNDYHALNMDRDAIGEKGLDDEFDSILETIIQKDIPDAINGFLTRPHLDDAAFITDIAGNYAAITVVRIEMFLWYICMITAVFGIMDALIKWEPYMLGLIAFIVAYSLINALISENIADTYYRYRAAIVAPVLLFADYKQFFADMKRLIMGNRHQDIPQLQ